MHGIDILVLGFIAAALGAAICKIVRDRQRGGCCGDCRRCAGCSHREALEHDEALMK